MTSSLPLKGLFFPYASLRSVKTLNTAIIYFDKIAVIDPNASFCRQNIRSLKGTAQPNILNDEINQYMQTIRLLINEGLIELIDPKDTLSDYGRYMLQTVTNDLRNPDFISHCKLYNDLSWILSSAKLPDTSDNILRDLLFNLPRHSERMLENLFGKGFHSIDLTLSNNPCASEGQLPIYPIPMPFEDDDWGALEHGKGIATRSVQLPFLIGESIMLSHALVAAASHSLVPFCDEKFHFDALAIKMNSAKNDRLFQNYLRDYYKLSEYKASMLAEEVFKETVPSLENIPIEEVLKFKEKRRENIEVFRVEMRKLVADINSNPWDIDFQRKIAEVVQAKIKPSLMDITVQIKKYKSKFWLDAIKTSTRVAPLPIIGSIWAGVPIDLAIGIGTGVAGTTFLFEKYLDRKDIKYNGFSLLIDMGRIKRRR